MDIDIYQQCPCHSNKKIKFCCGKDIVGDLNQIYAKFKSDQAASATSHIDRFIEKNGERDCLLSLKTFMLISQGKIEEAIEVNDRFLSKHPKHMLGLQHSALIALHQGDPIAAMNLLQDSMEAVQGDEIPVSVANAFRLIGLGLAQQGHPLAARAHFQYALFLKSDDELLQSLVLETMRLQGMPLLLKQEFQLKPPTEEIASAEWGKSYVNVLRLLDRGQFRRAYKLLRRIDEKYPDQPIVVQGLAALPFMVADTDSISSAWRRRAGLEANSLWEKVECEAIAQLFEPEPASTVLDIVRVTMELNSFDAALERLTACQHVTSVQPPPEDPFREGPPPRACFYVLDRNEVKTADELTEENLPSVVAEMLLYGKQTDREARLLFVAAEGKTFEANLKTSVDLLGDSFAKEAERTVVDKTTEDGEALNWSWRFPTDVSYEQHMKLVSARRQKSLVEDWTQVKFKVLDGKTPQETAKENPGSIPLQALLLQIEASLESDQDARETVAKIFEALGVEMMPAIDPTDINVQLLSPVRQSHVMIDKLTDEQLQILVRDALPIGNTAAIRKLIPELLERGLDDVLTRDTCFAILARFAHSTEESINFIQKAKAECKAQGKPYGMYLVQEFELYLSRGISEPLESLFQRISRNHIKEPGVEQQLGQILERYQLLKGQSSAAAEPPMEPDPSGLLLTDNEPQTSSVGESGSESKLWLPGQD